MNYLDVPVIDFSNAYSENVNERSKLAEEIGNVVTNIGFLGKMRISPRCEIIAA